MKSQSALTFKIMHVMCWIVFIGLCIKAGSVLISLAVSLFVNPWAAHDLYRGLDLAALREFNQGHYVGVVSLLVYFLCAEAYMVYLVILVFRRLDLQAPFDAAITRLINRISHVALSAGLVAKLGEGYYRWLQHAGAPTGPVLSGDEFLLLAGIIFIIAQVHERGTALQAENDLTI